MLWVKSEENLKRKRKKMVSPIKKIISLHQSPKSRKLIKSLSL